MTAKWTLVIALSLVLGCDPHEHEHADDEHHHDEDEVAHSDMITVPLKRQQAVEFEIATAEKRTIRHTFDAYGTLRSRTGGEGVVRATTAGRVSADALPMLGARVEQGEALAWLLPSLADQGDVASLNLAVSQAELAVRAARVERERMEGLVRDGAVARRRLTDAQLAEQAATAELNAARQRSGQARNASATFGAKPQGATVLHAPLSGVIVAIDIPPGQVVDAGHELFRILDPDPIWLEVKVPEVHVSLLSSERLGLWFEVDGLDRTFDVAPEMMSLGGVVNPSSRTLPVIASVPNPDGALRPGMFADVHVVESIHDDVAVPATALVIEDGVSVVYVARSEEEFERRVVQIGPRDGAWLAVERGLEPGERVVARGSYTVRLAALGDQSSADHGHAH